MNRAKVRRLVGMFGVLVVLEIASRIYLSYAVGDARMLQPDPRRLWRLAPASANLAGSYAVDSDGFRQTTAPGPDGAPLILTVGDSSIFGDGVADGYTIHEQLAATLTADGSPARGRSLAVPGYSTLQTRVVMQDLGWSLQPKVLVIGNLWSDSTLDIIRDMDLYHQYGTFAARTEIQLSKLGLFRVVKRTFNSARGKPAERVISWPQPGDTGVRRVPLADYAANLEALVEDARTRDIGVVFLGLCTTTMVSRGRTESDPVYPYSDAQYRVAQAHNLPYVDAMRVFQRSGMSSGALFVDDLHPSAQGDTLLARALATALEDAGWPTRVPVPLAAAPIHVGTDVWDGTAPAQKTSVAGSLANGDI